MLDFLGFRRPRDAVREATTDHANAADLKRVLAATPADRRISAVTVQRGITTMILEIERPAR